MQIPKVPKTFTTGFIAGAVSVLAVTVASLIAVNETIVKPAERYEAWIEDNKKKANRKAIGR